MLKLFDILLSYSQNVYLYGSLIHKNRKEKIMKLANLKLPVVALAGGLMLNSCVGTFMMTHKLAGWNTRATKSKILNEIIFLVISPAYCFTAAADALVLNSIEFWTGDNPMASVGTTQQVKGKDGRFYAVTTLKNGYSVEAPNGKVTQFIHDAENDSWSQVEDGVTKEIFRFNSDGTIQANLPDGGSIRVTPDEAGLFQTRMAMSGATFYAMQ